LYPDGRKPNHAKTMQDLSERVAGNNVLYPESKMHRITKEAKCVGLYIPTKPKMCDIHIVSIERLNNKIYKVITIYF
jgi:hypothetical protein